MDRMTKLLRRPRWPFCAAFPLAFALIMAMAIQGIPSARWNSDWRFVFVGGILLLAVVANNYIRTKAEAAR